MVKSIQKKLSYQGSNLANILLYFIGPVAGLLIFIIGVLLELSKGSEVDPLTALWIAFGVALITEFCVMLSLLEETK